MVVPHYFMRWSSLKHIMHHDFYSWLRWGSLGGLDGEIPSSGTTKIL